MRLIKTLKEERSQSVRGTIDWYLEEISIRCQIKNRRYLAIKARSSLSRFCHCDGSFYRQTYLM